ncbi:nucleotidyl transferase AbiEii/AbiGii toxin family protein [Seonamhaeicola sp.]|uniref:nucleotidyl transferase AbiEii/AbiGii toxin family protein n=1 Tax=Seonamhaeicola sp. TaxID=1912245 RepID=UPI00262BF58B|nr:nucleotidyl transferase AbiEii/AbiGii toxin family protein [Seonamhaeicola sp.]
MKNRIINLAAITEVADALKELKDKMVFVGGAVVSLYVNDLPAEEVRQTDDIDVTINLVNYASWVQMQERLAKLGFSPNPEGHAICSYLYNGISVDIMPSEDGPMGPANRWYKVGFDNLWTSEVGGRSISMLSAPCFLATKFEAFKDRGKDYRTSHDFEDIIYVLDNRTTIVEDLKKEPESIRQFLKEELIKVVTNPSYEEIISCHIPPLIREERLPVLKETIKRIIA